MTVTDDNGFIYSKQTERVQNAIYEIHLRFQIRQYSVLTNKEMHNNQYEAYQQEHNKAKCMQISM